MNPKWPFDKWWRAALKRWHLVKLKHDLRDSQKFQRQCERLGCVILAELEQHHQTVLEGKIRRLNVGSLPESPARSKD